MNNTVQSKEDLDEDLQLNNDEYLLGEDEESYNEEEDDDDLSDQLGELDDLNDPIDQEQYFEERAQEFYLFSLKKKSLAILYQNCQDEQSKKAVLSQILRIFEVKNYFNLWKCLSKQVCIQESTKQYQQDYIAQNECDDEQIQNSNDQNIIASNLSTSNRINRGISPILVRDFNSSSINSSQIDSCNFERNEGVMENDNTQQKGSSSFRDLKGNQSTNSMNVSQKNTLNEEFQNLRQESGPMIEQQLKSNQISLIVNVKEDEYRESCLKESFQGVISENQFMDQDQFDALQSESSNYNSLQQGKSFYGCSKEYPKKGSSQNQTHLDNQNSSQQTATDYLINCVDKKNKDSESSADYKMQCILAAGINNQPQSNLLDKQDEDLNLLNSDHKLQQAVLTDGRIFDEQQLHSDYFQEEQDTNELQVEQSIYDEKSMEVLSTKKESLHSSRNFQVLSNRSKNELESERRRAIYPSQEKENEKSYRKESTIKLNNRNNFGLQNSKGDQLTQTNNKNQNLLTYTNTQLEFKNNEKDVVIINSITQPTFQNYNEKLIIQNFNENNPFYDDSNQQYCQSNYHEANQQNQSQEIHRNCIEGKNQDIYESQMLTLNNQQNSMYQTQYQQVNEDDFRKCGQQEDGQINSARQNYFTQRCNNNDQRLSQIEAFSISKNIELTPTQQYMILSSRGNVNNLNHGQSVTDELEEQQEQEENEVAHEVALVIFGKKLFRKLRLAYHLTQYSSNEQLRQQQEKITILRKCFERLKEIKTINKKKNDIQSKLFKYYEFRYIRRPLQKWYENNKIYKAQKISLQIITNSILKINMSAAFQKIFQHSQKRKKETTVNNLLKYYERQSSLAHQKLYVHGEDKNSKNNKETTENFGKENGGYHRIRKEEMDKNGKEKYQLEFENSDKENNINLGNAKCSLSEAGRYSKNKENQSNAVKQQRPDKKEIQQDNQQGDKLILSLRQGGQSNLAKEEFYDSSQEQNISNTSPCLQSSDTFVQFQPKTFKDIHLNQNYKTNSSYSGHYQSNLNGQKSGNLSNFQSIQSTALGHYLSTEISDNDLNNFQAKVSNFEYQQQQQLPQTSNSSQQLQEIYNLINDKSSMVFDYSKKAYNNASSGNSNINCQLASSNSARSSSSCQLIQNNHTKKALTYHPQETGKIEDKTSNMNFLKQNANLNLDNIEKNLHYAQMQVPLEGIYQKTIKQNNNSNLGYNHQRSASNIGQFSNRDDTFSDRNINQSYLIDNSRKDLPLDQKIQGTGSKLNLCLPQQELAIENIQNIGNQGNNNNNPICGKEYDLDVVSKQGIFSKSFLNEQVYSKEPTLKYEIGQTQRQQLQEINSSNISLSPIPHKNQRQISTPTPAQIINNQKNYSNQYLLNNQISSNQVYENSNALSFTQSQIKNSLNVSSNQKSNLNLLHNEDQSYQYQLKDSERQQPLPLIQNQNQNSNREVGKIKRNSSNSQNRSYIDSNNALDTSINDQNTMYARNNPFQNNIFYKQEVNQPLNSSIINNKNGSSIIQDLSINSKQINNDNNNNNRGLVSFVDRNNSKTRLNQQLEQQAQAFNSRKLNQSRNLPINLTGGTTFISTHQQTDSKNEFLITPQTDQNYINNGSFCLNQQHKATLNNNQSSNQISKPPIQLKSNKIPESQITNRSNQKHNCLQNNVDEIEIQKIYNLSHKNNNQTSFSQINHNVTNNEHNLQQQNQKDISLKENTYSKKGDQIIKNSTRNCSEIQQQNIKGNKENSSYFNQNINYIQIQRGEQEKIKGNKNNCNPQYPQNNKMECDIKNSQQNKQHRSSSMSNNNLPQNYQNHIKNKEFSQSILEVASSIGQNSQHISKKKQEQINQLKQYQYFKQVQAQKQQQNQSINNSFQQNNNNSFSRINHSRDSHRNNDNSSRNISFERKQQQELSNVGQNIQNILYFEAKIRSKRLARSQERTKSDSNELCKKIENLESYIQQINHELIQEQDKRGYLLEQNQQLLEQREKSIIY